MIKLSRLLILIFLLIPFVSYASPKEIDWDDLIPWTSVFSPGEVKFNKSLVDKEVKIPKKTVGLKFEVDKTRNPKIIVVEV